MGPLVIESACFAYYNIFITIYGEEELNLGVLGRGRRKANRNLGQFNLKI